MKSLFPIFIFFLLCLESFSQSSILSYKGDTVLNNYLTKELHYKYANRDKRLKQALNSPIDIKAYQKECQKRYLNLLSNFPSNFQDTLPNIIYCGKFIDSVLQDYKIEKLILDKGITANLYLPKREGKKPAVLLFCGHEKTAKATESYQRTAILLAKYGFIVMVIDPTGQGERIQLIDANGPQTKRATTEHTLLNMGATLSGWSIVEEELLDNVICMNYLSSLPEVDKNNIGCIGNSGGGTQASYFSALDSRIKAVACCSWFTKRQRMFKLYGPDDGCQYLANEGREELEIADYYIMRAPRPTLILAGKKDFIDYQGCIDAFEELSAVYTRLGFPKNAQLFSVDDGHGISKPKREKAVQFFMQHLMNDSTLVQEDSTIVYSEKILQCTNSGQVLIDFPKEESLANKILKKIDTYTPNRQQFFLNGMAANRIKIRKLLNIPEELPAIKTKIVSKKKTNLHYRERTYILSSKNNIDIPIQVLWPLKPNDNSEVFIIINDKGIQGSINLSRIRKIIDNGNIVILADLRGTGETQDDLSKNNKKFYSDNYRNAALSVFIGKPLLGQQAIDLLSVIEFTNSQKSLQNRNINCIAYGNMGVVARICSYLDDRIKRTATKNCPVSWKEILTNPTEKNRMGIIVPDVLMHFDITDLKTIKLK